MPEWFSPPAFQLTHKQKPKHNLEKSHEQNHEQTPKQDNSQILLAQMQWSEIKLFYRQHLSYSKPSINDRIALIRNSSTKGVYRKLQNNSVIDAGLSGALSDVLSDDLSDDLSELNQGINIEVEAKDSLGSLGEIEASIRIKPIGKCQLVTGLVVAQIARGQGFAHQLLEYIKPELLLEQAYVFAIPELEPFYQAYGFIVCHKPNNDIQQLFLKYQQPDRPLILMKLVSK
ncbi:MULTISPECIES: GNAT family N-acetyltransferase [unclassified Shewanella]|uniref:GNAT family N-acetyltransferase n=1 Tax=unclassified Shewanella TaxID=196818 RepID=UPI003550B300